MHSLPELRQAYLDNADFDAAGSIAKAQAFVAACRRLLVVLPRQGQTGGTGGELFEFDTKLIADELRRAERFLGSKRIKPRFFDVRDFRE